MHILAFLVHPGALGSPQLRKISVEMKGDRDGKSAKGSATTCSAVDHMYPHPYIIFDPKGVIETCI